MPKCIETKSRRLELLAEPGVPTQTEVRRNLGSPLAEIFFASLDDTCKQLLGLAPPLVPPEQNELWMSPSDVLIGKVMLTPPMPTRRVVRALTHQGILEIGGQCLYKLENEARLDKERALEELEANMRHMAAIEMEIAILQVREEEKRIHEREVQSLLDAFHKNIERAVEDTETRLQKEMAIRIQEERQEIHDLMQDQMQAAVHETEETLNTLFEQKLLQTIHDLNNHYHQFIHLMADHFHWRLRIEAHNNARYIMQLRFHLEAQNETDISYAVCRERQRCKNDKETIIQEFNEQIAELHKVIESKIAQIEEVQKDKARVIVRCEAWESRIRDIVREFQKFINFALKAVPGQAEFLLSLEKLLILEMQKQEVAEEETESKPEPEAEEVPEPTVEETQSTEIVLHESGEEIKEEDAAEQLDVNNEEKSLEPAIQMDTDQEDGLSSGEAIASHLLGEMISVTASMADTVVSQTIEGILKKVVPQDDKPANPEAEEVAKAILAGMLEKVMGPEMYDASTQAPPIDRQSRVQILGEPSVHYLPEGIKGHKPEEDAPHTGREPGKVPRQSMTVGGQECGWCEIKETKSLPTTNKQQKSEEPSMTPEVGGTEEREPELERPALHPEEQSFQERGIVGVGGIEHQQQPEEFLGDRVQALLRIFRENPSVVHIFMPHCGL